MINFFNNLIHFTVLSIISISSANNILQSVLLPNSDSLFFTLLLHPFIHVNWWELILNILMLYLCARFFISKLNWWELVILWIIASVGGGFIANQWSYNLQNWGGLTLISTALLSWSTIANIGILLTFKNKKIKLNILSNICVLIYLVIILLFNRDLILSFIIVSLSGAILGCISYKNPRYISNNPAILNDIPPINDYDYYDRQKEFENEINRILEKIKNEGETSLTNTEKEFLDEYAKRRVK